ncbi:MAG TPA: hypothetical protein VNT30_05245 [Stellaceae bacterium]|nr:hypothetical protein [Stellaceae bacterium]
MRTLGLLLSLALLLVLPQKANAQQKPSVLGIFGDVLHQGQIEQQRQAAASWAATDSRIIGCLQNNFRININQLIQNGIPPTDPRIQNTIDQCNQAIAAEIERQRQQALALQQQILARQQAQADAERERHAQELATQAAILKAQANAEQDRRTRELAAQAALIKAKADADQAKADAVAKAEVAAKQRQDELAVLRDELSLAQLVGDDPKDLTVLIVTHDTPRIVRNLSGDATFRGRVDACSMLGPLTLDSSNPEGRFNRAMMETVVQKGGGGVFVSPCSRTDFGRFDLLVFSAGQLANTDPDLLRSLVTVVKDGSYVKYAIYHQGDYETQLQARKAKVEEDALHQEQAKAAAKTDFLARDDAVISAIYSKIPASSVCLAGSSDGGLRYLVKRNDSPFVDLIPPGGMLRDVATKDAMFLAYKTGDCAAVVGPTGMIKEILAAFARDSIAVNFHPGTITADRLAHWRDVAKSASLAP